MTHRRPAKIPVIWHVGSADLKTRTPLIRELRSRSYEVAAVGPCPDVAFSNNGIPYHQYTMRPWLSPASDVRSLYQLRNLFRKHKPDIVHGFTTKPALMVPFAARGTGVRAVVQTITGTGYVFSSSDPLAAGLRPIYAGLQRLGSRYTSATVFQNSDDREFFLKNGLVQSGRDFVAPGSGIDVDDFLASGPSEAALTQLREELGLEGRTVVTMISRLMKGKGVREYLEASDRIRGKSGGDKTAFLVVGEDDCGWPRGVPRKDIEKYRDVAQFLGHRQDVRAILAATDIFVFPTHYGEGIPRVLLEAASLGIPIVTTDMDGCREVVQDGENGLLVPPKSVKPLEQAIRSLLESPDLRKRMGRYGDSRIRRKFGLMVVADAYSELYDRLLSEL